MEQTEQKGQVAEVKKNDATTVSMVANILHALCTSIANMSIETLADGIVNNKLDETLRPSVQDVYNALVENDVELNSTTSTVANALRILMVVGTMTENAVMSRRNLLDEQIFGKMHTEVTLKDLGLKIVENSKKITETSVEDTPVEDTVVEDTVVEDTVVEDTVVEDTVVEDTVVEDTPVEE